MSENKKVLIAIDTTLKEPYISMTKNGPFETWAKYGNDSTDVLLYYSKRPNRPMIFLDKWVEEFRWNRGKYNSLLISYLLMWLFWPFRWYLPKFRIGKEFIFASAKEIKISILEARFTQRWKKISAINYFLTKTDFDFLLLITPSCYINKKLLMNYILTLPVDFPVYSGSLQQAHDGPFVAGGTLIMNRRAANIMIKNRFKIPTHLMDDVAFGIMMHRAGVKFGTFPFLNLDSVEHIQDKKINDFFYIRVKEGLLENRKDSQNMQFIHRLVQSKS